jgi:zinc protease
MVRQVGDAFGSIPRGVLPRRHIHLDRPQKKLQVVVLHKPAMLPVTMLAFHAPNFKNPDQYPLTVLSALLSGGRSSILYRKMVYEHPVAVDAEGSYDPLTKGPSLFYFYAQGMPKTTPPYLKRELTSVINSLKTHPVSQSALDRAKKGLVSEFLMSQESTFGMGMLLGEMATLGVPMTYLDDYVKNIQAVTPSDITRVAKKYLNSHSETIGYLYPSGKPKKPVFRKPGSLVR